MIRKTVIYRESNKGDIYYLYNNSPSSIVTTRNADKVKDDITREEALQTAISLSNISPHKWDVKQVEMAEGYSETSIDKCACGNTPASKPRPASELEPMKPAGQITEELIRKNKND